MRSRGFAHPVAVARRATRRRAAGIDEGGFTLIELLITVVILPIVIGGIAAALLAVFGLQDQTQNRIGDSNDAQVGSANFNKDVQSAEYLTTASFATAPGCGSTGTQLLGLEWAANSAVPAGPGSSGGYDTVVSYVLVPWGSGNELVRQECTAGPSSTPTTQFVISHDAGALGSPTITPASVQTLAAAGWTSALGVTAVTFHVSEPGSGYSYTLTGLPGASTSTGAASQVQSNGPPGCSFANPGTGTYARQLLLRRLHQLHRPRQQVPTDEAGDRQLRGLLAILRHRHPSAHGAPPDHPHLLRPHGK